MRKVSFFVFFSFVVCIGSFLIQLSFIHFNVVIVIGHDDIKMYVDYKLYNACDTTIGLEFEEAFLRTSIEREETSHSDQAVETAVKLKPK